MSLCCFPFFRLTSHKKPQSERGCFSCCRKWRKKRHYQYPWPSDLRDPQNCNEDVTEELADGFTYMINRHKAQVRPARETTQCLPESSNVNFIEKLADGFSYIISRHKAQVRPARETTQCLCESSNGDSIEELVHGPHCTTHQVRVQVHQADDTTQCLPESSNVNFIENLADGFSYLISRHKAQVRPARETTQCLCESSNGDSIEELVHGPHCTTHQVRVQVHQADDTTQCLPESSNVNFIEKLADGFSYLISRHKAQVRPARETTQCLCESSNGDSIEELVHGPHCTTHQVRVQVHQAYDTTQCLPESSEDIFRELVSGFSFSPSVHQGRGTSQCWPKSAADLPLNPREACRMRALQEGPLEKVAASMAPALLGGTIRRISTLMPVHPAFCRAQRFLDQLFTRSCPPPIGCDAIRVFSTSGGIAPYNDRGDTAQDQVIKAIAAVTGTWTHRIQYFGQSLLFPWFTLKQAFVLPARPASHPKGVVKSLWVELEHLEQTEAEGEESPPELQSTPEPEEGPAQGPEPSPAVLVLGPVSPPSSPPDLERAPTSPSASGPAGELEPSAPPALIGIPTAAAPDHPRAVTTQHLLREEKPSVLTFPPRLVAEQLTAMDAELFRKVLPHQCLGSVWSQRAKPGKEHLASTVQATITQFNRVVSCVITTCLGDPSMTARDRATVVEHWIKVAGECRTLRNFSSLHAILSALLCVPVHRLKEMWGHVSRRSSATLEKLCEKDNSLRKKQLIKKRPSRLATLMLTLQGAQKRQQKCVPFLGKFLTDLEMLDTKMEDYVEGNQINLKKKQKEQKVMQEIVLLQEAAENYRIEPEEQFWAWFRALERLSDEESYLLSCQRELGPRWPVGHSELHPEAKEVPERRSGNDS